MYTFDTIPVMGPDELVQMAHVAERHYHDGVSRIEIAKELGISRFRVARLLEKALRTGVVKIEITSPGAIDLELSIALKSRFGLRRAIAVITPGSDSETVQESLGTAAAQLLTEIVEDGMLVGLTAGRTLNQMASKISTLAPCDLVALSGIAGPVKEHGVEVIRRVARISGGQSWPIFAPLIVESPETAASLRRDPLIAKAYARFSQVDIGVVAVGSWNPPDSQLYDASAEIGLAENLVRKGVVGEICAALYDVDGNIINDVDDRALAIATEDLRKVPEVIAVGGGDRKTNAILGALRSNLVDSLVTDATLAKRLLSL